MSNTDVVNEMKTIHEHANEIPNDNDPIPVPADTEPPIADWSKEIHGVASTGYLNDNSPLQFNNRKGHNWQLMVILRDVDSSIKKFCWILAINKSCGARNFLLQILQDHPEIAFVVMNEENFVSVLEGLDVSLSVFDEDRVDDNVSIGISIIEAALYRRRHVSVEYLETLLQK